MPLVFAAGCDKYSGLYGTYYYKAGTCATSTDPPYNNISIGSNIEGEFVSEDFYAKLERKKLTVRGTFSPELVGTHFTYQIIYEKK